MKQIIKAKTPIYALVRNFCATYDMRAEAITERSVDNLTLKYYSEYNEIIDRAISAVCEVGIREQMRRDIGAGIGLNRTTITCMSDGTYKRRKRDSMVAIAKELHLIGDD